MFRPAQALVGGTGIPDEKGKLAGLTETGASVDTFQGRYVEGLPAEQ